MTLLQVVFALIIIAVGVGIMAIGLRLGILVILGGFLVLVFAGKSRSDKGGYNF